jgi:hypothetical protein
VLSMPSPFLSRLPFFTSPAQRDYRTHAVAREDSEAKRKEKQKQLIHISPAEATSNPFVVQ